MTEDVKTFEMVAYQSAHITDETPWRCMLCEKLTKHTHDGVVPHLMGAHNLLKDSILKDSDGMFVLSTENKTETTN